MSTNTIQPVGTALRQREAGVVFRPNSWAQHRAIVSDAPEMLYSGRYGSSKSRTLCEKADLRCRLYPGAKVVVARKKRTDLGTTTLPVLLEEVITDAERAWGWRVSADGGSRLLYDNGSSILVVGLDNPGKLRSGAFDLALVDQAEELDETEWNAIAGRLRHRHGPYRQLAGFCNPEGPSHFLYKRFAPQNGSHIQWSTQPIELLGGSIVKPGAVLREVVCSAPRDNIENLGEDYQLRFTLYSGHYYDRYVLGKWVAYEGAVLDCYDESIHVIEKPAEWAEWGGYPPPTWKRYRTIDFGYTNPFVCQWWARSPDMRWYLYREIYMSKRLVVQHREVAREHEARELSTLIDCTHTKNAVDGFWPKLKVPTRLSFSMTVADQEDAEARAQLASLGMSTTPAVKARAARTQTLYEMLKPRLDPATNRTTSLVYFIRNACVERDDTLRDAGKPTCTYEELPGLQYYKAKATGRDRSENENAIEGDDHGFDACSYLLHTHKLSGEVQVISLS